MTKSITVPVLIIGILLCGMVVISSCTKGKGARKAALIPGDSLSAEDMDYLVSKELVTEGEKILFLYTNKGIENDGALLSINKIALYSAESKEVASLDQIFDIAKNHSTTAENPSKITVYLKNDTEFTMEFLGASNEDERFFDIFRHMWRLAISTKQKSDTQVKEEEKS